MNSSCRELRIPIRLRRLGRPANSKFDDCVEQLFRWYPPNVEARFGERLSAQVLKDTFKPAHNVSCARSKYCRYPQDVLYNPFSLPHRDDHGVIKGIVHEINGYTFQAVIGPKTNPEESITLRVRHVPEECLFPHSEIEVLRNGELVEKPIGSKNLKATIRYELAKKFQVCHEPDPEHQLKLEVHRGVVSDSIMLARKMFYRITRML